MYKDQRDLYIRTSLLRNLSREIKTDVEISVLDKYKLSVEGVPCYQYRLRFPVSECSYAVCLSRCEPVDAPVIGKYVVEDGVSDELRDGCILFGRATCSLRLFSVRVKSIMVDGIEVFEKQIKFSPLSGYGGIGRRKGLKIPR